MIWIARSGNKLLWLTFLREGAFEKAEEVSDGEVVIATEEIARALCPADAEKVLTALRTNRI
jgi:hypothetical protein